MYTQIIDKSVPSHRLTKEGTQANMEFELFFKWLFVYDQEDITNDKKSLGTIH